MATLIDILHKQKRVSVLQVSNARYAPLDLSVANGNLTPEISSDCSKLGHYIDDFLENNNANIGYGGYNERRGIYRRSTIFNDNDHDERNIHIGMDLWAPAGTSILAALGGEVHSFKFNGGQGNYGPTVILQHKIENLTFYTLYGHLDMECLPNLSVGQTFRQGDVIGRLGSEIVNGDYPPHLHFQIIGDIGNHSGDYTGVCSTSEREFCLSNCPDQNLLLKRQST